MSRPHSLLLVLFVVLFLLFSFFFVFFYFIISSILVFCSTFVFIQMMVSFFLANQVWINSQPNEYDQLYKETSLGDKNDAQAVK